ncbi:MAG TPA: ABC transporter permease subunit [Mycobacteriales bacterium]|nr:ABC transporter permease subunit [Mycobacteriales bacterium]
MTVEESVPVSAPPVPVRASHKRGILSGRFWRRNGLLYLMLLPGLIHLVVFKYAPLFGLIIAFQKYSPFQGVTGSQWVGLHNFSRVFHDDYILTLLKNTFLLAAFTMLVTFVVPIVFAVLLNEVRNRYLKKTVQTLSFLPYFISSAVLVSIFYTLLSPQGGLVNQIIRSAGGQPIFFLADPDWFRPLYVTLSVWQTFGYSTIIYIAAMTTIDSSLYEACEIDGGGRWKKMFHVTLPGISNMMIILFILNIGQILSVDVEKVLLMYSPGVYSTADVVQTYVYRLAFAPNGFPDYSYGAAVGIIQAIIALVMIWAANRAAKRFSDSRLF